MTNMELKARFEQVENKEQLIADLKNVEEDEAVLEVLKNHGLDIRPEELEAIMGEGELDADALDQVAGGCKCSGWLKRLISGLCEKIFGIKCLDCA